MTPEVKKLTQNRVLLLAIDTAIESELELIQSMAGCTTEEDNGIRDWSMSLIERYREVQAKIRKREANR